MINDKNLRYYDRLEIGDEVIVSLLGKQRLVTVTAVERNYVYANGIRYGKSTGLRADDSLKKEYLIPSTEAEIVALKREKKSEKLAKLIDLINLALRAGSPALYRFGECRDKSMVGVVVLLRYASTIFKFSLLAPCRGTLGV